MRSRSIEEESRCALCKHPSDDEVCAHCRDARDLLPRGVQVGGWVKVRNERGVFRVMGFARDGSVTLYGGTAHQSKYRAVMADRLTPTKGRAD